MISLRKQRTETAPSTEGLVASVLYGDTPRFYDPGSLRGLTVFDADGEAVGEVRAVYLDKEFGLTEWAAVVHGRRLLRREHLVPLVNAIQGETSLRVPYPAKQITAAPHRSPGELLSKDAERELFSYYGLQWAGDTVTAAVVEPEAEPWESEAELADVAFDEPGVFDEDDEDGYVDSPPTIRVLPRPPRPARRIGPSAPGRREE